MVTSLKHRLPFRELGPHQFEQLCYWWVREQGYQDACFFGEGGSEQGRDISAVKGGKRFVFQCKRVKDFGRSDAKREIAKVSTLPLHRRPDILVFLVTASVSAAAREEYEELSPPFECLFLDHTELDYEIRQYPAIMNRFFFTPSDCNRHLAVEPLEAKREREAFIKLDQNWTRKRLIFEQAVSGLLASILGFSVAFLSLHAATQDKLFPISLERGTLLLATLAGSLAILLAYKSKPLVLRVFKPSSRQDPWRSRQALAGGVLLWTPLISGSLIWGLTPLSFQQSIGIPLQVAGVLLVGSLSRE